MRLVWNNCKRFNAKGCTLYNDATALGRLFEELFYAWMLAVRKPKNPDIVMQHVAPDLVASTSAALERSMPSVAAQTVPLTASHGAAQTLHQIPMPNGNGTSAAAAVETITKIGVRMRKLTGFEIRWFDACGSDTIISIKWKLYFLRKEFPVDNQIIMFNGVVYDDRYTLANCGIGNNFICDLRS